MRRKPTIAILDIGTNNLTSVYQAFQRVGMNSPQVISSAEDVGVADAIALPGVGAFEEGMAALRQRGFMETIRRRVEGDKVPFVGICLGMQLLADSSEENGFHEGLGLIPGKVRKLDPKVPGVRIPNIGWCDVTVPDDDGLITPGSYYFAHSYFFECAASESSAAHIEFGGQKITAAVRKDHVFGTQFHMEKSQDLGLDLIFEFVKSVS